MNLKSKYKKCLIAWLAEFVVVYFLDKAGVQFHSILLEGILLLLFLLPIIILFALMSQNEEFSKRKRFLFKAIYIFIIFCYAGGLAARLWLE